MVTLWSEKTKQTNLHNLYEYIKEMWEEKFEEESLEQYIYSMIF